MADSVKVAVRVRPFNGREKALGSKLVVDMKGKSTYATDPETGKEKSFAFDYSFWSHSHDNPKSPFVPQPEVFDKLGNIVLKNSFMGYNCTILAYGQTGSGKSYSMVGADNSDQNYSDEAESESGLIPRLCKGIFDKINNNTNPDITFNVEASMMEIYNEKLQDLLKQKAKGDEKDKPLKIRESPSIGPYVEGLTTAAVSSFDDLSKLMSQGTRNRTIGATSMNAQSSRAHTIVTVTLTQTTLDRERFSAMDKVSRINLVDLAGSERQKKSEAKADRLKEGCAINQSLSTLGKCISAIAKGQEGAESDMSFVPFRDSALTWLLSQSLGGNAKTIMVATISPADFNYAETMSTLRYAWQAKQIKTRAVVNEDPNDRLIRELREEIELLRAKLSGEDLSDLMKRKNSGAVSDELAEKEEMIANLNKTWEQRLKETQNQLATSIEATGGAIMTSDMLSGQSYLINLHEDNTMTKKIAYPLTRHTLFGADPDESMLDGANPTTCTISGVGINKTHVIIETAGSSGLSLTTIGKARACVNGVPLSVDSSKPLEHGDRVVLGMNHVFVVCSMQQGDVTPRRGLGAVEWKDAMEETLSAMHSTFFDPAQQAATELEMQKKLEAIEKKERKLEEERVKLQNKLLDIEAEQKSFERKKKKRHEGEINKLKDTLKKEGRLGDFDKEKAKLVKRLTNMDDINRADLLEKKQSLLDRQEDIDGRMQEVKEKSAKYRLAKEKESQEVQRAEEDIMQLIPCVDEAATMAQDMAKQVKYEVRLQSSVSPEVFEDPETGKTMHKTRVEAGVSVHDLARDQKMIWSYDKFMTRLFLMREAYQQWTEDNDFEVDKYNDPFLGSDEAVEVGKAHLWLMGLRHMIDVEDTLPIISNLGANEGKLNVRVLFANENGEPDASGVQDIESMTDLYGSNIDLCIEVLGCKGIDPKKFSEVFLRFKFYEDDEYTETEPTSTRQNTDLKFRHHVFLERINHDFITFLENDTLTVEVWGLPPDEDDEDDEDDEIGPLGSRSRGNSFGGSKRGSFANKGSDGPPELKAKVGKLEQEVKRSSVDLNNMKKQLTTAAEERDTLKNEVTELRRVQGKAVKLEGQVKALNSENDRLRAELARMKAGGKSDRKGGGGGLPKQPPKSPARARPTPGSTPRKGSLAPGVDKDRAGSKSPGRARPGGIPKSPSGRGGMAAAAARDPYKPSPRQHPPGYKK